jgi:hypothetical protein
MREVFGSHNKQQHRWFHSSLQIANSENPNTTAPSAADVDYYINEMNLSLRNGKPEEALEKFKVIPVRLFAWLLSFALGFVFGITDESEMNKCIE